MTAIIPTASTRVEPKPSPKIVIQVVTIRNPPGGTTSKKS